jgi:hypothetical protein
MIINPHMTAARAAVSNRNKADRCILKRRLVHCIATSTSFATVNESDGE